MMGSYFEHGASTAQNVEAEEIGQEVVAGEFELTSLSRIEGSLRPQCCSRFYGHTQSLVADHDLRPVECLGELVEPVEDVLLVKPPPLSCQNALNVYPILLPRCDGLVDADGWRRGVL